MDEYSRKTTLSPFRIFLILSLAVALVVVMAALPVSTRLALWYGLLANRVLLSLLVMFSLITLSLLWSAGHRLDAFVFLYFNRHRLRTEWLDRIMWITTQIGNGFLALTGASLLYLFDVRRLAVEILIGVLSLWLTVEFVKAVTARTRPYLRMAEIQIVGWRERGKSFPSGHTAQTFFLMALLAFYFQLGVLGSLFLYGLAVLVGFTRIYIGVHYPRDVIAGAVLGSVWAILTSLLDPFLASRMM